MLKSNSLSTQSLASCELLLWNFQSVPKHCKKVPLQVFDIVQFSRSCVRQPFDRRPVYFTTPSRACQALFSKCFQVLGFGGPLRGALKYNTTTRALCQGLFYHFLIFFLRSPRQLYSGQKKGRLCSAQAALPNGIFWQFDLEHLTKPDK